MPTMLESLADTVSQVRSGCCTSVLHLVINLGRQSDLALTNGLQSEPLIWIVHLEGPALACATSAR